MVNNSEEGVQIDRIFSQCMTSYLSYVLTCNLNEIQQSVRSAEEVFHLLPKDDRAVPLIQFILARSLTRRFLHTRQVEDITLAIDMLGDVSQLVKDSNRLREMCLHYLKVSCLLRDSNLEGSVEPNDLHVFSASEPDRKTKIETLTRNRHEDSEVFTYCDLKMRESPLPPEASLEDIDSVIQFLQLALKFFSSPPYDTSKIWIFLSSLGDLWKKRYIQHGVREDNDKAVDCFCRALKLPMTTSMRASCLRRASEAYIIRYEALSRREDLDIAVSHAKLAVEIFDSRDAKFVFCLDTLARAMTGRYRATGEVSDLDAAIRASLRAVNTAEQGDRKEVLPQLLTNLAVHLEARFTRTGQTEDLRHAIAITQRAAYLWPNKDPQHVLCLVNLSNLEVRLSDKLQDIDSQQRSLECLERICGYVMGQDRESNPGLNVSLYNLRGAYLYRMNRWDEAIEITRQLDKNPDYRYHPHARECRLQLCDSLFSKWKETKEGKYLDEIIITARHMIKLKEADVDYLVHARKILGIYLWHRYESTRADEDLKEALDVWLEGFRMSAGSPFYRILTGLAAIILLWRQAEWKRANELAKEVVDLIMILNGPSLQWADKQFWMNLFSSQIPIYASIALQAETDVIDVIDMLEKARCSILGNLIDQRTDVNDLKKVAPEKAKRFSNLRDKFNAVINPSGNMNTSVEELTMKSKAEAEIRGCLEDIRKLKGFDRFLLGPTKNDLHTAASQGPIIIVNVTSIRSDAIIITKDARELLPLPELKYKKVLDRQEESPVATDFSNLEDIGKKNRSLVRFLKWLWNNCVKLIFHRLDELVPGTAKFHVWWIGIGIASSLPFHAAGIYTPIVQESALFKAISSYTPTLKILIHGRRRLEPKNDHHEPNVPNLQIISMPTTPGQGNLEGVLAEAERIQTIARDVYSPRHKSWPTAKETMELMEKCEIMHFACHGQSILTDPSSSHLLLQATNPDSGEKVTDELRVRDVAVLNLSRSKLAVLSACSTAENKAENLWDEALHLAAGFHVAGYLRTVGNLWPADDDVSVQIMENFYHHLVKAGEFGNGQNVAKALNEALTEVMLELPKGPLCWASFVHFGI